MKDEKDLAPIDSARRAFTKTAVYVAPAILTLSALPSFASSGSGVVEHSKENPRPTVEDYSRTR
jgi:hypothetical protein